jgi:integrase
MSANYLMLSVIKARGGFVFRDLRSTCKTLMARAGIDKVYRDALLGHAIAGMDRHYMNPDFEKDLRVAMARWTSWLRAEIEARESNADQTVDQNAG